MCSSLIKALILSRRNETFQDKTAAVIYKGTKYQM